MAAPKKPKELLSVPRREQPLEDSPLAEMVAKKLEGSYARVPGLGWLLYTGKVWEETPEDNIVEAVRKILRDFAAREIAEGCSPRRAQALSRVLSAGKIRSVAGLLRGVLEVPAGEFDAEPDLLNVANGVVDLRTGELSPHDPAHRFTKITKADYRPGARSRHWTKALSALPRGVRPWMQARLGQGLTGYPPSDDMLAVSKGAGANGKSTLFDGVRFACGSFAGIVPDRILTSREGDHPTELTTLRGLRLAFLEELPEGARFSVKRLKDIIGTESITARKIRENNMTWAATHSLFITTNYSPRVSESDHGTWRRLALVRFPYTFRKPGERLRSRRDREGDPTLRDRMRHASVQRAILAWLVEGAKAWYAADKILPPVPDLVVRDTERWRAQTDLVLGFAQEHLVWDANRAILTNDLVAEFDAYLKRNGHPSWGQNLLVERFGNHTLVQENAVTKVRRRPQEGQLSLPARVGPHLKHAADAVTTKGAPTLWLGVAWASEEEA